MCLLQSFQAPQFHNILYDFCCVTHSSQIRSFLIPGWASLLGPQCQSLSTSAVLICCWCSGELVSWQGPYPFPQTCSVQICCDSFSQPESSCCMLTTYPLSEYPKDQEDRFQSLSFVLDSDYSNSNKAQQSTVFVFVLFCFFNFQ